MASCPNLAHCLRDRCHYAGSSPYDGKTYPNYLLWHPRDHISLSGLGGSMGGSVGDLIRITEFFIAPTGFLHGSSPATIALSELQTYIDVQVSAPPTRSYMIPGAECSPWKVSTAG